MVSSESEGSVIEHRKGSIISLLMKDFMSFTEFKWYPDQDFNIVLGPNGTGKSTLMCAICLVMGGHPSLSGRSGNLRRFVKLGAREAIIEVKLFGAGVDNRNLSIRRRILADRRDSGGGGSGHQKVSTFWIDGREADSKEVLSVANGINIDLSSLCQYLPQDRVAEFNKKGPEDLLREIEACVDGKELLRTHDALVGLGDEARSQIKLLQSLSEKIKFTEQKLDELQPELKRIEELEALEDKLLRVQLRELMADISVHIDLIGNVEDGLRESNELLDSKMGEIKSQQTRVGVFKSKIERSQSRLDKLNAQFDSSLRMIRETIERSFDLVQEVDRTLSGDFEAAQMENALAEVRTKIRKCEQDVAGLEKEIADHRRSSVDPQLDQGSRMTKLRDLRKEYAESNEECQRTLISMTKLKEQLRSLMVKSKSNLSVAEQSIEYIKKIRPDVITAHEWIQSQSTRFRRKVYDPPVLSVSLDNSSIYKYIETTIPGRDYLNLFMFEDLEDLKFFMSECVDKLKLSVNVGTISDAISDCEQPIAPLIDELRQIGFESCISSHLRGPPKVINYLRRCFGLDNVLIGPDSIQERVGEITTRFRKLGLFFAGNCRYNIINSRYSSSRSTLSRYVREARFKPTPPDTGIGLRIQELEKSIADKCEEFRNADEKRSALHKEISTLGALANKHSEGSSRAAALESRKNRLVSALEVLREREVSLLHQSKNLVSESGQKIVSLRKHCQTIANADCAAQFVEITKEKIKIELSTLEHSILVKESESKDETIRKLRRDIEEFTEKSKSLQSDIDRKLAEIEQILSEGSFGKPKTMVARIGERKRLAVSEEFDRFVSELCECCDQNDSSEDLKERIREMRGANDDGVKFKYQEKKTQLKNLKDAFEKAERQKQSNESNADERKSLWIKKITHHIESAARMFSDMFKRMGHRGTMRLVIPADPNDFSGYGVRIDAHFGGDEQDIAVTRNTKRILSGGEQSVTAIIFILSLQALTQIPFLCIDEINQGMDPDNERAIFELMVDQCKRTSCQYIYLSPKPPIGAFVDFKVVSATILIRYAIFLRRGQENQIEESEHLATNFTIYPL